MLYLIVFFGVMLESTGVPLPGETILLASGFLVHQGALDLGDAITFGILGAVIGDQIGYWVGREGGRPFVLRWGRYVLITPERLGRAENFFHRHGGKAVFLARFVAAALERQDSARPGDHHVEMHGQRTFPALCDCRRPGDGPAQPPQRRADPGTPRESIGALLAVVQAESSCRGADCGGAAVDHNGCDRAGYLCQADGPGTRDAARGTGRGT